MNIASRILMSLAIALAAIFTGIFSRSAFAAGKCPAGIQAQRAAQDFIRAGRSGSRDLIRRALYRHVDMHRVMVFALGRHFRRLTPAQRRQYFRRASAYAAHKLAKLARMVKGSGIEIVRCHGARVVSRLKPGGDRIIWKFRGRRIVDVNFRGIWMAQMLRGHFQRKLREADNNMQTFLARLD